MQNKTVHIVFQVLNFLGNQLLSKPYDLSADEKLLLIFLSKHKGRRGIYPSVLTLAKELQRSESAIRRSLRRLKKKNLILIDQIPGKSSQYTLIVPDSDLSTAPGVHAQGDMDIPLASTPGEGRRPRQDTPGVHARQSIQSNNPMNNTERAHTKRAAPLSEDFEPSEATAVKAKELGFKRADCELIFDKFMNYHLEKGLEKSDWQLVLQNWFIKEAEWKKNNPAKVKKAKVEEPRSTVPWFKPEQEAQRGAQGISNLLNGIAMEAKKHLNNHGEKPNGLGNERGREKKED